MGNPWQSYRTSLAIWDHTVLPATRHKWMRPAITPAKQAGTRFTYPGRMEGWVDLGSLIAARSGIEPTTAWSQVRHPNTFWSCCSDDIKGSVESPPTNLQKQSLGTGLTKAVTLNKKQYRQQFLCTNTKGFHCKCTVLRSSKQTANYNTESWTQHSNDIIDISRYTPQQNMLNDHYLLTCNWHSSYKPYA